MKIVVIGAGITGRLAKIMLPESRVLESKPNDAIFTAELGVHISISPIPGLVNRRFTRYILIDGQTPSFPLIQSYRRKINRDGALSYGDLRQFEPEQAVYRQTFPRNMEIEYGKKVQKIDIVSKRLFLEAEEIQYDVLISTIPLMDFLRLTNLLEHFRSNWNGFFMHRPIYLQRIPLQTEDGVIRENYITDPENPVYRENFMEGYNNRESLFKTEGAFKIYPGKIYNCSDTLHILDDLRNYSIYCCGRYAQWDSKIHLWNTYGTLKAIKEVIYV